MVVEGAINHFLSVYFFSNTYGLSCLSAMHTAMP